MIQDSSHSSSCVHGIFNTADKGEGHDTFVIRSQLLPQIIKRFYGISHPDEKGFSPNYCSKIQEAAEQYV